MFDIAGRTVALVLLICCAASPAMAQKIDLNPAHPERYVVVKGDTLWDISARFLRDPWLWPEVWQANPQIANPHLIYPGDTIALEYRDGKPVLRLERGRRTVKLSPKVRVRELDQAIPTIDPEAIRHFLNRARVASEEELNLAPYVLGGVERRLLSAIPGERIYARGVTGPEAASFGIYRIGKKYLNPADEKDVLGHEVVRVATAVLEKGGDPATLRITGINREIRAGDRLLPLGRDSAADQFLFPRAPRAGTRGSIISVFDGVTMVGQYQGVVLNLGRQQGIQPGHVLAVYQANGKIQDPVTGERVELPDERAGVLLVFRTFDRVSYALLMESTRPVRVGDGVRNP
ncbi:MAG TPA: LysM peptidoglycan-binding domain-containing protein [Gammaproteobacteria bacterium]|nr:LysM peptidoglycan-binding domain-containing protein [Gammaproteobacteria bacterium]